MPRSPENFAEVPAESGKIYPKVEELKKDRETVMNLFRKLGLNEQIDIVGALSALKEQNPAMDPRDFLSVAWQMIEERQKKATSISNAPAREKNIKIEPRRAFEKPPAEMFEDLFDNDELQKEKQLRREGWYVSKSRKRPPQKPPYKDVGRDTIKEDPEKARGIQ